MHLAHVLVVCVFVETGLPVRAHRPAEQPVCRRGRYGLYHDEETDARIVSRAVGDRENTVTKRSVRVLVLDCRGGPIYLVAATSDGGTLLVQS